MKEKKIKFDIKKINWLKGLPGWSMQELNKVDWIVSLIILAGLFLVYFEGDLIVTGNRSFLMYHNFRDFYKASYEQSHAFYANYLPSTFIAFAVWNIPLYLLGRIPILTTDKALLNICWYKLLPVIIYFITAHLVYKVALLMGFGEKKAKMCKFAFLVCPLAVYSQFIFSQYDIFTVFFLVLALYFYFRGRKHDMWLFALACGIGTTFKYQVLAYFFILLILKEKKFRNMIKYGIVAVLPAAIEIIPHLNSPYFYRNVFGFSALGFVNNGLDFGYMGQLSPLIAMGVFLAVWSYQKVTHDKSELISWALFFCTGVSFTIFGFCAWHPQWFLIMIPFFILSVFMNSNGKMFLLSTSAFIVILYMYLANAWEGIFKNGGLTRGIFRTFLEDKTFLTSMEDIYPYGNTTNLLTCIWVLMLVYFVFNHPRFHTMKNDVIPKYTMNYIRGAFLVGVLAFVIPSGICMADALKGEVLYLDNSQVDRAQCNPIAIYEESSVEQLFEAKSSKVTSIKIKLGMYNRINDSDIHVAIIDRDSGEIIHENDVSTFHMVKEESMYEMLDGPVSLEPGKMYSLQLTSTAKSDNCVATYYTVADKDDPEKASIPGEETPVKLIMRVEGLEQIK